MASIVKRGKSFSLVYEYKDAEGVKRQKWETYPAKKQALTRKAEVEDQINKGSFIPPSITTVREFLEDFVAVYGTKRWGLSAYEANTGLIENYINPIMGDCNVQDINRRAVDRLILELQKTPPVSTPTRRARTEFLPPYTIEKICKLLHCAFHQAVRWEIGRAHV